MVRKPIYEGTIALTVERRFEGPCVSGSSPLGPTEA